MDQVKGQFPEAIKRIDKAISIESPIELPKTREQKIKDKLKRCQENHAKFLAGETVNIPAPLTSEGEDMDGPQLRHSVSLGDKNMERITNESFEE